MLKNAHYNFPEPPKKDIQLTVIKSREKQHILT